MAYCKVGSTKCAVAALRYGEHEEKALVSGKDCPDDTRTAEQLFKADRIQWQKDKGIQAHIVIQSFKPGECTKEEAHQIGVELAEKMFPDRRAMIYTHDENGIPHNHIVAENVSYKDGSKLSTSGLLNKSRALSNEITLEHGLSVIDREHSRQDERHTMAERALIEKGEKPWKQEMREAVQEAFNNSHDIDSFKANLKEAGITVSERMRTYADKEKDLDFTYQDQDGHKCRAYKLGDDFTRRDVIRAFEMEQEQEKATTIEPERTPDTPDNSIFDRINDIRESRQNSILERADATMDRYDAKDAEYYLQEAAEILDLEHLAKIESPQRRQQAISNGIDYVSMAASLGNAEAQAFLQNNGGSPENCKERWDLLTEQKKDEIRAKNMYKDDYGDEEHSLMTGYKPKVREMEIDTGFSL